MVCPYSLSIPGGVQAQVLGLARELGDMELENQALEMLSVAERQLGRTETAVSRDADRVRIGAQTGSPSCCWIVPRK